MKIIPWDIGLDLDDTCMPNSWRYSRADCRCAAIIVGALRELSPSPEELLKIEDEIDIGLAKEMSFTELNRFPKSWQMTYETACDRAGVKPEPAVLALLWRAAHSFQQGPFRPFPGVLRALAALRRAGHRVHLITIGNPELQRRKAEQSGLISRVDSFLIIPRDKRKALAELAGAAPGRVMMVGDSLRSDIKPAKELGLTSVLVEANNWIYNQADVEPDHRVKSLRELPALVARLAGG